MGLLACDASNCTASIFIHERVHIMLGPSMISSFISTMSLLLLSILHAPYFAPFMSNVMNKRSRSALDNNSCLLTTRNKHFNLQTSIISVLLDNVRLFCHTIAFRLPARQPRSRQEQETSSVLKKPGFMMLMLSPALPASIECMVRCPGPSGGRLQILDCLYVADGIRPPALKTAKLGAFLRL